MKANLLALALFAAIPTLARADPATMKAPRSQMALQLTSSAFRANQVIPPEFTCDGTEKSPPLAWSAVPAATKSIALLVEDADSPKGSFTNWLVTGLPATTQALPAGGALPQGATAAKNSKGNAGYSAPCPAGGKHRYYFHVFALDSSVSAPTNKLDLLTAVKGHVLAEGQLMGTYQKITTP